MTRPDAGRRLSVIGLVALALVLSACAVGSEQEPQPLGPAYSPTAPAAPSRAAPAPTAPQEE